MFSMRQHTIGLKRGRIGLIADTHGLLRPEALGALKNSELIIHAGDIGKSEVLDSLNSIAPVIAIRGNNDRDKWARKFPDVLNLTINSIKLHVIHDVNDMEIDPLANGFRVVISGHSHMPRNVEQDGVRFINPGSAGPRRFKLPVAVGTIRLEEKQLRVRIIELKI
jgi:uncharacterized protein